MPVATGPSRGGWRSREDAAAALKKNGEVDSLEIELDTSQSNTPGITASSYVTFTFLSLSFSTSRVAPSPHSPSLCFLCHDFGFWFSVNEGGLFGLYFWCLMRTFCLIHPRQCIVQWMDGCETTVAYNYSLHA